MFCFTGAGQLLLLAFFVVHVDFRGGQSQRYKKCLNFCLVCLFDLQTTLPDAHQTEIRATKAHTRTQTQHHARTQGGPARGRELR